MRRARLPGLLVGSLLGAFPLVLMAAPEGRLLYVQHCGACHDRGREHPGTARLADRWPQQSSLLDREALPVPFVRHIVRHGLNLMPPFRPGELSEAELQVLAEYLDAGPHPQMGETK